MLMFEGSHPHFIKKTKIPKKLNSIIINIINMFEVLTPVLLKN